MAREEIADICLVQSKVMLDHLKIWAFFVRAVNEIPWQKFLQAVRVLDKIHSQKIDSEINSYFVLQVKF